MYFAQHTKRVNFKHNNNNNSLFGTLNKLINNKIVIHKIVISSHQ